MLLTILRPRCHGCIGAYAQHEDQAHGHEHEYKANNEAELGLSEGYSDWTSNPILNPNCPITRSGWTRSNLQGPRHGKILQAYKYKRMAEELTVTHA